MTFAGIGGGAFTFAQQQGAAHYRQGNAKVRLPPDAILDPARTLKRRAFVVKWWALWPHLTVHINASYTGIADVLPTHLLGAISFSGESAPQLRGFRHG